MLGALNKSKQGASVLLPSLSAAASRIFTTIASSSAEASAASSGKSALHKEFQVYRYLCHNLAWPILSSIVAMQ